MDEKNYISAMIKKEILSNNIDVKGEILKVIGDELDDFIDIFSDEFLECKKIDSFFAADTNNIKGAYITAYVYSSMNNLFNALSLLLSGYIIAAGNLTRISMESIMIALLFSGKDLDYYNNYIESPKDFRAHKVFKYIENNKNTLRISDSLWTIIIEHKDYFNTMSHASDLTLHHIVEYNEQKSRMGVFYDNGKNEIYKKEFALRRSVLNMIGFFIYLIKEFQGIG